MAPSIQEPAAETATSAPSPEVDLGVELASVTRALEWAAGAPERVGGARWLGTSCARRLDAIVAAGGGDRIAALASRMRELDDAADEVRESLVAELLDEVAALSPLSTAGARIMGLPERGRLLQPRRRRRKDKNKADREAAPEPETVEEPPSEPSGAVPSVDAMDEAAEAVAETPAASSDEAETRSRSRRRSRKGRRAAERSVRFRVAKLATADPTIVPVRARDFLCSDPNSEWLEPGQEVRLGCATEGAVLHYSTDGSAPRPGSRRASFSRPR